MLVLSEKNQNLSREWTQNHGQKFQNITPTSVNLLLEQPNIIPF